MTLGRAVGRCRTPVCLVVAGGLLAGGAQGAKGPACPIVYHLGDVRLSRPNRLSLPERDRVPFPDAKAKVTCTIGPKGDLTRCRSDLHDARGPALASDVSGWRILGARAAKCAIRGHVFAVTFHLRLGE